MASADRLYIITHSVYITIKKNIKRTEAQAKIEATKKYTKLGILAWIVSMIIFIIVIATGVFTIERNSKCTICKEPATKTFQSSPYCEEHYIDAVKWAFNNVAGN